MAETVRCPICGLAQFLTVKATCRKCKKSFVGAFPPETVKEVDPAASESMERSIANNVKSFRAALNLSQRALAMKMGIPRTYISKVENGKILPYTAQMRRLAAALNVTVGQLLDTSRERTVRALMEDSFIAEIASVGVGMHRFQQAVVVEAARKMANG